MEKLQLKANLRETDGKLKALRKSGQIPAVLYGHKIKNMNLSVNLGEFNKIFQKAGESTLVELQTPDGKNHPVLIHDVQMHFLTSAPQHVDFYEVSMTEKLKAKVALEFIGVSPAVKTLGAILVKILYEVEVECLPADLPHNIQVDISRLATLQDAIHIKDLKVSEKVKILGNPEELVIKVQPPRDVEKELASAVDEKAAVEAAVAASTEKKEEAESESSTETKKEEKKQ